MHLTLWSLPIVRNPYSLHKMIWNAFPDMPEAERSYLFRTDPEKGRGKTSLLLLSQFSPNGRIQGGELLKSIQLSPRFRSGERLAFSLRGNPTLRSMKTATRVPLAGTESLSDWISRKFDSVALVDPATLQIKNRQEIYFNKKGQQGKVVTVDFEGILTCTNPEGLVELLQKGIGPAKAFGCGLVLLKRAT